MLLYMLCSFALRNLNMKDKVLNKSSIVLLETELSLL